MSGKFTTEVGCIVRSHAPICHDGWKKVPETDKKKLLEALLVKFDLDLAKDDMLIDYIDDKMSTAYTLFKHRLHDHYKKCKTPEEGRAKLPKPDLWNDRPLSHWNWLCDLFKDPYYQNGKLPSFINNWGDLHLDRNQQWISEAAQEKHEKMKQKRDDLKKRLADEAPEGTPFDSIEVPLESEFQIMAEDLGRKGRTIRGLGSFPRMQKSTSSRTFCSGSSMDQWTEMQTQFSQIVGSVPALQKENEKLRAELEAIKGSHGQSSGASSPDSPPIKR